jgi:pilus assembly protein CpaB
MKKKTIFLISIIMAGLATFLFYQFTNQMSREASSQQQMKSVIVAALPIKKDEKVTEEMLKKIEVPAISVHPEAILEATGIIGKYSTTDLAVGEVILQHHLQSLEQASSLSGKIRDDDRAVTIPGGKIETLANMIEPEDRIDIIYTGPPLDGEATAIQADTIVLKEDVMILAVGRRMKTTDAFAEYDSITVKVQQKEAVKLIKASKKGTFNFILRSKGKTAETKVEGS